MLPLTKEIGQVIKEGGLQCPEIVRYLIFRCCNAEDICRERIACVLLLSSVDFQNLQC